MDYTFKVTKEKTFGLDRHRNVLCKNCGNTITSPANIIAINGEHIHTFTNPSGVTYTVACYASAPGCVSGGIPTLADSWFDGFSWSFALCSYCLIHLGWLYQNEREYFYGLILDALTVTR